MKPYVVLKNVELQWPYLGKPQTKGEYASNKYQTDIVFDKAAKEALESIPHSNKQKIKELDDGRFSLTLKTSSEPFVVDNKKMRLSSEDCDKIGNGSIANVKVISYEARGSNFYGLGAIRIVDLKEYVAGLNDLFDDDEEESSQESKKDSKDDLDDDLDDLEL